MSAIRAELRVSKPLPNDVDHASFPGVLTVLLILLIAGAPPAEAAPRNPTWISASPVISNDGFATLRWTIDGDEPVALFRVTEEFRGERHVSFTEKPELTVFRIDPGAYVFRTQACDRDAAGYPECGSASAPLILQVRETTRSGATPAGSATVTSQQARVIGGPGDLRPGLWHNPLRSGHGWSFYWANRLALPETHALHGYEFDLLAFWYTYEAKVRYQDGPPPCGEGGGGTGCYWAFSDYRPLLARLRLVRTGDNTYQGGIYITRQGFEVQHGSATVTFGPDNTNARVDWTASFKWQALSGSDPIRLLAGGSGGGVDSASHHAGLWSPGGTATPVVATDVGSVSEAVEVVFYDSDGDPGWIQAARSGTPVGARTDLCFYYVHSGYAPGSTGNVQSHASGCNPDVLAGAANRNGSREFTGFEAARIWVDYLLPDGRRVQLGTSSNPAPLVKQANFHRIWFNGSDSCGISLTTPTCTTSLTWFTDGDYTFSDDQGPNPTPNASAYAYNQTIGHRTLIATSTSPAMVGRAVALSAAGTYVFELRMSASPASTLLAQSSPFTVVQAHDVPAAPTGLALAWTHEANRDYVVQWNHTEAAAVDRYTLVETLPGGSSMEHTVTPGTNRSKAFSRHGGPFGTYGYRVRACYANGGCSADTPLVQWTVTDPGSSPPSVTTQYPWSANAHGNLVVNQNLNYALGYHFSPLTDGHVTHLGGYFAGAKVVKLFRRSTGTLLAQATVTSSNAWSFATITPVAVAKGAEYTVAAYLAGSGASYRSGLSLPKTYGDITILRGTSVSTSSNPNAIPTNNSSSVIYGQADIGFQSAGAPQRQPPQMQPIPDRQNYEGDDISLQVIATDADGTITGYTGAPTLPPGLAIGSTGLISGRVAQGATNGSPYRVTIVATDSDGLTAQQSFTWTIAPQPVGVASPETPPPPAPMPSMTPSPDSSRVGATTGVFEVDQAGSATYRVPIMTAPGSGGMAPELGLEYSSQVGNGPVGVGWSVTGLSTIGRCAQTLATDGPNAVRGITLAASDRFCLDGQRLIAVTGADGEPGTEYRTQIDGISKIVSNGKAGTGPQSFTVWHKDGSVSEYGATADARIEARSSSDPHTVLVWAQNRVSDQAGNYIDYAYFENAGTAGDPMEFLISRVAYTGNTAASTLPFAEIEFLYDGSRPDTTEIHVAGARIRQSQLLVRIDSRARVGPGSPMETLRSYQLTYGSDGHGRRTLVSITECRDSTRTHCFPATTFEWQRSRHEIGAAYKAAGGVFDSQTAAVAIADITGDGRPDLLLTRRQSGKFVFEVAPALPAGGFGARGVSHSIPDSGTDARPVGLHAIDLNADGFQDVLYPDRTAWKARLSNGTGLDGEIDVGNGCCGLANPPLVRIMDFDGDGLSDLVTVRASSGAGTELVWLRNLYSPASPTKVGFAPAETLRVTVESGLFPEQSSDGWVLDTEAPRFDAAGAGSAGMARPFDYDGDGAVDMLVRMSQRYVRCSNPCSASTEVPASGMRVLERFTVTDGTRASATETLSYAWASYYLVLRSRGALGFIQDDILAVGEDCTVRDACNPLSHLPAARRALPVDINADGLADFAFLDAFYDWRFRLNSGGGFFAPSSPIAVFSDSGQSRYGIFADLTGDGYPDFMYPNAIGSQNATWMLHQNAFGFGFAAAANTGDWFGNTEEFDQSLLLDFTGDGLADNLFIDFDGAGVLKSSGTRLFSGVNALGGSVTGAFNAIGRFTDGHGASHAVAYKPLTDTSVHTRMKDARRANWGGLAVYDLVAPAYVVSQADSSAPTFASAAARSLREYHYVGAKLQGGGRGFLGFGEVITYDPQAGIRSNSRYRQDFPFTGLLADMLESTATSSTKFARLSNSSATSPVSWGAVTATTSAAASPGGTRLRHVVNEWRAVETVAGRGTWFPYVANRLERQYTLTGSFSRKVLTTSTITNAYGNLNSVAVRTYATDGSTVFATQTTNNTYADEPARWRLGLTASTAVTHARAGKASVTRKSSFGYDGTTGILNRETLEPGHASLEVDTTYQLDTFGNRILTAVTGAGMPKRTTGVSFDTLGRYPVQTRNAYGQVTSDVMLRDAFGNVLRSGDINGVVTITAFDHMGRAFLSWTESGAWHRTLQFAGAGSVCPGQYTAWHVMSSRGGQPSGYQCFDALGREVRNAVQGFDGTLIFADTRHDSSGRVARVSEPYFQGASPNWSETVYDAFGRTSAVLAADGNDLVYDYDSSASLCGIAGGARQMRATNGLGQRRLEILNALGETIKVIDNACGAITYDYDATGNLISLTGADGVQSVMTYDPAGRRTSVRDDDRGYWQYRYNALGELTRQLDGKNQALDFTYDLMGRVTTRHERTDVNSLSDNSHTTVNVESTTWINATSTTAKGKAQPGNITYRAGVAGAVVHQQNLIYDALGRLSVKSISQEGLTLAEETTYDQFGRLFQQFDASGDSRGVRFHYNAYGHVERVQEAREGISGVIYQHIKGQDERGNVTYAVLGGRVETFADHDPRSGRLRGIDAYDGTGAELQRIEYEFDRLGNLRTRHDTSRQQDLRESFSYDPMNRLESVMLSIGGGAQQQTLGLRYDAAGNITSKSDVGDYLYGAGSAGPHAVTSAGGLTYTYDANGSQVASSDNRKIAYTVFEQAARIEKGTEFTEFAYGIGNRRIKRVDSNAIDGNRTIWYFGTVERIQQAGQNAYFRRYIGDVALVDFYPATGARDVRYLLKDHLGSIHTVVGGSGLAGSAVPIHFGSFGERQNPSRNGMLPVDGVRLHNLLTSRGFTGHEHADGLGVIHMNGRIYDPRLGRFLQADPFVQDGKDSQSLNRYSYVLNNPLSYTDPSGYFSFSRFVKRWGRVFAGAAAAYFTYGWANGLAWSLMPSTAAGVATPAAYAASTTIGGAAAGLVAGAIADGTVRGALSGAIIGATFAYAGMQLRAGYQSWKSGRGELWKVRYSGESESFVAREIADLTAAEVDVLFVNGQSNSLRRAIDLAYSHLGEPAEYYVFHNPPHGLIADTLESVLGKIFNESNLSRQLAEILQHEAGSLSIVTGHSQGAIILSNALRHVPASTLRSSTVIHFHGAGVGPRLFERTASRAGAMPGAYRAHPFDAVPNVFGMGTLNPVKWAGSVLMVPLLFTRYSPHSIYEP